MISAVCKDNVPFQFILNVLISFQVFNKVINFLVYLDVIFLLFLCNLSSKFICSYLFHSHAIYVIVNELFLKAIPFQNFRMSSQPIKRLVINPSILSKPAKIHRVRARAEDSKVTKQSEEMAEFDSSLPELPEFAAIQKQDEPSTLVQDPTEDINIGSEDSPKILKIGTSLSTDEKERLIDFLKQYQEVFAWTYEDMPGLDPKLVEHRLVLKPDAKPVKQKLRKMDPRIEQQVKEGLEDLLKAGFIRAIDYLDWLANIVAVPKKEW